MAKSFDINEHGRVTTFQLPDDGAGKQRWQARTRVRDDDGVTRQVSATEESKTKAERSLQRKLRERVTPSGIPGQLTAKSKFKDLVERWLEHVKANKAVRTYTTYESVMRGVVLPQFGELTIAEVTASRVMAFMEGIRPRYTKNGQRQVRKVLSSPLTYAAQLRIIQANPVLGLPPIEDGVGGVPSRALTSGERRRLLEFVDNDERAKKFDMPALVRFMLTTGVRISEALAVRWCDVDLEQRIVHINGGLVRAKGHGSLIRAKGKSRMSNRHLYIPSSLVLTLHTRWNPDTMSPESPVFPSSTGTYRDLNNLQREVRYVRESVPGLAWITTHTFRRTAATVMDDAGMSPRQIADQLGHARPSMTQDVYIGRGGFSTERASEVLEKSLVRGSVE